MSAQPFTALGIDVGGTKIAAAVVKFPTAEVIVEDTIPTRPKRAGTKVLSDLVDLADTLSARAKRTGNSIRGVGVGVCELISSSGEIITPAWVSWDQNKLRLKLKHLGPVTLEADVRAAACAEARFGAGRSHRIFLYVTIGTGIASCLMIDGKPYVGARGATGTMASSPLGLACAKCGHVETRSLEEIASGPAIARHYRELRGGAAATALDVTAAAQRGDANAVKVIRDAAEILGATLGMLVGVLDPEALIVGGGLGLSEGLYWKTLVRATRRHIWSEVHRNLPIVRAATGRRAGVIGSAWCAWQDAPSKS